MTTIGATTSLISVGEVNSDELISCNGCKLGLEGTSDSVVVSFGSCLWHVDCRCAKCQNLVEHDTNLLLLSDGSPVCENCSYICSVCQKPISHEAIVTGDESYHADCFRCRSCNHKIEELIFAKTSQGIWCMACHNERVARSRKHAEAKRSRTLRKEKEAKAGRSKTGVPGSAGSHEAFDLAGLPRTTSSAGGFNDLNSLATGSTSMQLPSSQARLFPSSASMSTISSNDFPDPATPDRQRAHSYDTRPGTTSASLPSTSSLQSVSSLARNAPSYSQRNQLDSLPSSLSLAELDLERTFLPSKSSYVTGSRRPHGLSSDSSRSAVPTPPSSSFPTDRSSPVSSTFDASITAGTAAGQGSLSAPAPIDKSSNRRSGFYGSLAAVPTDDYARSVSESDGVESEREKLDGNESPSFGSTKDAPSFVDPASNRSFLPELHNSISFYDPDTILFLDHVGNGGVPAVDSTSTLRSQLYSNGITDIPSDQVEDLVAGVEDDGFPGDGQIPRRERQPSSTKSEISRKVRESIRESRGDGTDRGMGMDVDLVELLLSELDSTKNEMSELQAKYNAFRRASRSAFEGFSMAREEYDREVAARRDAEGKMEQLKIRFTEQALKLAAVDQEQKVSEAFQRKSKELRLSVSGMEKHLSELKAEVELSTAQVEELALVEPEDSNIDRDDIANSLGTRLEKVKDDYRREIEALIQQKQDLTSEVNELRQSRALFIEETTALNREHSTLTEQNLEATRQLAATRDSIFKLRPNHNPLPLHDPRAQYSNSNQLPPSSSSSNTAARSTFPARSPAPSPTPPEYDVELISRSAIPEPALVGKKFKWGKGKVEPSRQNNGSIAGSNTTNGTSQSSSGSTARVVAVSRSSNVSDSTVSSRIHFFQQTSILRPVKCDYCGDKMWGLNEVRCGVCGSYTHAKCSGYLTSPCSVRSPAHDEPLAGNPSGHVMFGNDLTAQAYLEGRQVPIVVTKCIAAVEAYGMNYEGIYRKSGGNGQTKLITQYFERGQDFDLQDLDKFNDLAAVTSCMKNFFRSLPDPLFTHDLHEEFVACIELPEGETRLAAVEATLYALPEVHFYTAQTLMAHLHRIYLRNAENKMTSANIGVVLGPTLMRSRDPSRELSDMGFKAKIVEMMVVHQPRLFSKAFASIP